MHSMLVYLHHVRECIFLTRNHEVNLAIPNIYQKILAITVMPEIAWNRQLIAVIRYKATAALTNTYKYWYI